MGWQQSKFTVLLAMPGRQGVLSADEGSMLAIANLEY
jgi:hypothetical protein